MKINVLGTEYDLVEHDVADDSYLENCDGYCDKTTKMIVFAKKKPDNDFDDYDEYCKKVIRHEIIHAFLNESGLQENFEHTNKFGHDETTIDWFAVQFPKILQCFKDAGCL